MIYRRLLHERMNIHMFTHTKLSNKFQENFNIDVHEFEIINSKHQLAGKSKRAYTQYNTYAKQHIYGNDLKSV